MILKWLTTSTSTKELNNLENALSRLSAQQAIAKLQTDGVANADIKATLAKEGYTQAIIENEMAKTSSSATTVQLTSAEATNLLMSQNLTKEKAEELLVRSGLITTEELEKGATIKLNAEKLKEVVTNEALSASEKEVMSTAYGVTTANAGQTLSFKVLTASIKKAIASMKAFFATPLGWITLAVAGIAALVAIVDKVTVSLEEQREKLKEVKDEYEETTSTLQSLNNELKTTKERLKELEKIKNPTFSEKEEYENLVKINNEKQRQLDLLKLEEKQKRKEKNAAFVATMEKAAGNPSENDANPSGRNSSAEEVYVISEEVNSKYQLEQRKKLYDDLSKLEEEESKTKNERDKAKIEKEKKRIQGQIDEIDDYLSKKSSEWSNDSAGIEYIQSPSNEEEEKVNQWLDFINDFQDKMAIARGGDNAKTNAFNRVIDNWQFDDTVQGLQDLGEEGKVTAEMLNDPKYDEFINKLVEIGFIDSADNLDDIALAFNDLCVAIDETDDALDHMGYTNNLSYLDEMKEKMDILDSTYSKLFKKDEKIGLEDLTSITEAFKEVDGIENYIKALQEAGQDAEKVDAIMEQLIDDFLEQTILTQNLSEETRNLNVSALKEMGITNAEEIIDAHLQIAEGKRIAEQYTDDFTNATDEEIQKIFEEVGALDIARQAIFYYQLQKVFANENRLDTSEECANLLRLANNAGVTGQVVEYLTELEKIYQEVASGTLNPRQLDEKLARAKELSNAIQNQANNFTETVTPIAKYNGGLKTAEARNKAAKDAADAFTDALQKQIDALNLEKDALEKQKDHYEEVIDAINWFYDQQIEKVQDLIDALEEQNELLSEQQENYDMALSAIDRFYQDKIELIEKEQEAIDKRIEALQEENEERKKQYELEQKQLALERARNQKTALTYTADKGYVYMADETAIKDAENELADAELDNAVSKLEKERESLQESINKLEEYRELWGKVADEYQNSLEDIQMQQTLGAEWEAILLEGRIEAVTSFKDKYVAIQAQINSNEQLIKSHEEKIEYYESLKEEWENLTNKYKEETYIQLLIGEFGNDYESQLLDGRTERWETFADEYAKVQRDLKIVTDQIEELERQMQEYKDGLQDAAAGIDTAADSMLGSSGKMKQAADEAEDSINRYNAALSQLGVKSGNWGVSGIPGLGGGIGAFSEGGIVGNKDESDLDYYAKSLGEDHLVAVQDGEAIIPQNTVKSNPELVDGLLNANGKSYTIAGDSFSRNGSTFTPVSIPNLSGFGLNGFDLNSVAPKFNNKINPGSYVNNIINGNGVNITIGDIHLSGVQDVNGLSNAIINKLPNTLIQALGKI